MCKKLVFLTSFVLVLALAGTNVTFGAMIERTIAEDADDAEEAGAWNPGAMEGFTSSDLEMPYEDTGMGEIQIIGLRYTDIAIPKGATIVAASVQFQVDEIKDGTLPVNLIIEGELTDNAPAFTDDAFNISLRPRTTAMVQWSVPSWIAEGDRGPDQATPDISAVIQEIVNQDGWASGNALVLIISDDPANPSQGIRCAEAGVGDDAPVLSIEFEEAAATIIVEAGGDIAAANELAKAGDTIDIAAGTFVLAEQIEIKDGVTYQGAGAGLTIIDGNNVTRAFVAWGDRRATDGQVDANGLSVPNATGPKDWVLDGMTIQNCVADTENRQNILSAARDLLDNYTGVPYTLATAQAENGGIENNPGWFDILSGSADDDLTDAELQAYLDANPVGSAGHLVVNDDKNSDGGAITIDNGAVGTIANCEFLNNHTPAEGDGDDGGAVNITGLSVVTINNCLFDGNYAVSPDSLAVEGLDGDGGHIKVQGASASAITPGTTLIANRCVFLNGNASDDGGAIQSSAVGTIVRLDACWFEGNNCWDNGTVLLIGNESSNELTVTNCVFVNNIAHSEADVGDSSDRMCQVRRNSKFINCTFVGNHVEDQDIIYNNANKADTDADGVDDEMEDATQVINCLFANNTFGGDAKNDSVLSCRNNSFTVAATNCLFFNNLKADGSEMRIQNKGSETGSVLTDPLLDANYVPQAGSPAIDTGVDVSAEGVTTDYNGDLRPQGAAYDIGAYEAP